MFTRAETRRLEESELQTIQQRCEDVQFALRLTYITLGWMTIEGAASLWLGWASKSLLLEAFGIDSVIELFSAGVLLWRLRVEASGSADETRVEAVERRASKWVGYTLYFLVLYVVFNSAYGLFVAHRVTDTHESAWGILIGLVAKIGMPILAGYKLKVAARLNSRALRADAIESNHVRLSFYRVDGWARGNTDFRMVVARQRGSARADSLLDQRRPCCHFRRRMLLVNPDRALSVYDLNDSGVRHSSH